jgi:FkbM family methyltransferase
MYSQHEEEEIIVRLFQAETRVGHFLDIGAYDGQTFSNTLRLVELGWSGVCVEPSPSVFTSLLKRHGNNPKITLINSALGLANAFVPFWDAAGDAISTTNHPHKFKWERGSKVAFTAMVVYTVTFADLFKRFGLNFDFINLDVEGISAELFMAMPLQTLERTRCLCVEHDGQMEEIRRRAKQFGFEYVHHNGENIILFR